MKDSYILVPSYTIDGHKHHLHITEQKSGKRLCTFISSNKEELNYNIEVALILMHKLKFIDKKAFYSLVKDINETIGD